MTLATTIKSLISATNTKKDVYLFEVTPLELQIHNHLDENEQLGHKKLLFLNLKKYYSEANKEIFDYLPLTYLFEKQARR